jgi:flagellar P-ring protein FlgI
VAAAINNTMGAGLAQARDAAGVEIRVPADRRQRLSDFLSLVENVRVEPDRRARVVIDERTGTVVAGGDVRIAKVTVTQDGLKVSVVTENAVSQPLLLAHIGPGIRTEPYSNTRVSAEEGETSTFVPPHHATVAELVLVLARMKKSTRDIISILRAVKAQGALHAELVVQ